MLRQQQCARQKHSEHCEPPLHGSSAWIVEHTGTACACHRCSSAWIVEHTGTACACHRCSSAWIVEHAGTTCACHRCSSVQIVEHTLRRPPCAPPVHHCTGALPGLPLRALPTAAAQPSPRLSVHASRYKNTVRSAFVQPLISAAASAGLPPCARPARARTRRRRWRNRACAGPTPHVRRVRARG
jgi:hypothetical protein